MNQNVGFTREPKPGQLIVHRGFCRVTGHKKRMFVFIGLRMNADPAQGIQINLHHMTAVVLNRRIERGERFHPAATRQAPALIRLKADGDARFQTTRQTRAVPVFGQVNQHVILTAFQGVQQGAVEAELFKPALLAPVAPNSVHLVDMRMAGQHRLGIVINQRIDFHVRPVLFQHGKNRRGKQNVTVVTKLNNQHALWRALR